MIDWVTPKKEDLELSMDREAIECIINIDSSNKIYINIPIHYIVEVIKEARF
ncbi:MAG: hypothetical protein ACFFG0_02460 [Candidatus Thorarchaeota archaeon]